MRRFPRRTALKVKDGKVQRKSRWAQTASYYSTPQDTPVIVRERPGPGHRHVLKKRDLVDFISILPDWDELSKGLNAILLAPAEEDCDGWHDRGVVAICAWPRELWIEADQRFCREHADIFRRLGVPCERIAGAHLCKFSEATVRAYQLLHIFLHELGHHHDRMTTRSRGRASRGDSYAEQYARRYEALIWGRYAEVFEL